MNTRIERKKKRKPRIVRILFLTFFVLILGGSFFIYNIYSDMAGAVNKMHNPINREISDKREEKVEYGRKDPISLLIVGVDERDGDAGRTDSMLVVTVNPDTKSTKIMSIPRDTKVEIIDPDNGDVYRLDKINHAYAFGGIKMSISTVENFLNIPIDYYAEISMEGFKDIVDAVGGINVNNQFAFELDGVYLEAGEQHLNGEEALQYARMRKEDPQGDFGRQERQREVISKVIEKGATFKTLTNYGDVLEALEENIKTNLTLDEIIGIQFNYKSVVESIDKIAIDGTGKLTDYWYFIVDITERQNLSDQLRAHLGLPLTTIDE